VVKIYTQYTMAHEETDIRTIGVYRIYLTYIW